MRGSIGLVIGVAVGAGAMYLVLRPPWGPRLRPADPEGPPVVIVGRDAGVTKPKQPKQRWRPAGTPAAHAGDGEAGSPEPRALTAADRALEWRGDDVTLPAQRLDLAGSGEARPLDDGEINATINRQAGGVKDCVVQGATGTDLGAIITVELVVDGHGRVIKSRVHAPRYLFVHGLLGCAQRALGRLRFPATGRPTLVTFPVNLE